VATDLPWVVDFERQHNVLEVRSNDPEDFLAGIEAALDTLRDDEAVRHRREVAALSDWESGFAKLSTLIEGLYAPGASADHAESVR
jgi:hypothetical protein